MLRLSNNTLTGTIPTEVGRMEKLTGFSLAVNDMRSSMPTELGLLTALTSLSFFDNAAISGSIVSELANLSTLKVLRLFGTQLSGSVPSSLCVRLERAEMDCDGRVQCDCCTAPGTDFVAGSPCETAATP
uniref:L domain-like protein n=1 Tax=Grammatophora oceanica TaxID=210454 RepID=A0A7S1Y6P5_9STRA